MTIVTQLNLLEHYELGELEKIYDVLDVLPTTDILNHLEKRRKRGRQDYSVQSLFIAYIAKIVLQIKTDKQLIRQLNSNSQLRELCGFESHQVRLKNGKTSYMHTPSRSTLSRFSKQLESEIDNIEEWVYQAVARVYDILPDFGKYLALDGKIIESYAPPYGKNKQGKDGRGDSEADTTVKVKHNKNGHVKEYRYYGYRCHLIADTTYELPVSWQVTPASKGEPTIAKYLIKNLSSQVLARAKYLMADKGYSGAPLQNIIEDAGMIVIIDNKHQWKEDETRQYLNTDLIYNQDGQVWWVDDNGKTIELIYKGDDKSSDSIRFGFHLSHNNPKIFRLKRRVEPIIFSQVARSSEKFKRLYKKRTSVERVNGRLDRDFGLEDHTIRGLAKFRLTIAMDFMVMLCFALSKLKQGIKEHLAS